MARDRDDVPGDDRDDDRDGAPDAHDLVAEAAAQLDDARRSGRSGAISLAHLQLAATLEAVGDHASAVTEFESLIAYLELAQGDTEAEEQRLLRLTTPASPPPTIEDFDRRQLQALARIHLAESLLALGRRADAQAALDQAAPAARGFGRGRLRRRLREVQRRLDGAKTPVSPQQGPPRHGTTPVELVAAAEEMLDAGEAARAARLLLVALDAIGEDAPAVRGRARRALAAALEAMQQPDDAARVLGDSLSDFLAAGAAPQAAEAAIALAWRLGALGRAQEAVTMARRVLSATEGSTDAATRIRLMTDLGSLEDQAGDAVQARRTLEAAARSAEAIGDAELLANAHHGLAVVLASSESTDREDVVEALSLLDRCRATYDDLEFADRAAGCEHEAAALLGRLGSADAALARYQRALTRYEALPEADRDTGTWPDEVADVRHNIDALAAGDLAARGLFLSGGHAMHHRSRE